jgi:hypothetical protein
MKAAVGDRMVIAANRTDGPVRDGEILEVGPDGNGPFRVRWSDTGHETLFYPGPDAHVQHFAHEAPAATNVEGAGLATQPSAPEALPGHTKSWRIDVYLYEGANETSAQAVLHGDAPSALKGHGVAHRNPADPDVPEIGDEVAVARALARLSQVLLGTAADDLSGVTGHQVTLDR